MTTVRVNLRPTAVILGNGSVITPAAAYPNGRDAMAKVTVRIMGKMSTTVEVGTQKGLTSPASGAVKFLATNPI